MKIVSLIIAIFLIILHLTSNDDLPTICVNGFQNSMKRNFYHVDSSHLYINLLTFKIMSRIETQIGSQQYLMLLLSILIISTILDYVVTLIFPKLKCSIGFSGILFGLLAWEMLTLNEFSPYIFILLAINVISPTVRNPSASLLGHGIGAIAGIITATLHKYLYKDSYIS